MIWLLFDIDMHSEFFWCPFYFLRIGLEYSHTNVKLNICQKMCCVTVSPLQSWNSSLVSLVETYWNHWISVIGHPMLSMILGPCSIIAQTIGPENSMSGHALHWSQWPQPRICHWKMYDHDGLAVGVPLAVRMLPLLEDVGFCFAARPGYTLITDHRSSLCDRDHGIMAGEKNYLWCLGMTKLQQEVVRKKTSNESSFQRIPKDMMRHSPQTWHGQPLDI